MTQTKPLNSGNDGSLLSPREEAERFAVVAARFRERMMEDPAVAEKLLRDIGYYEVMEQQRAEEQEESASVANGAHSNGASNGNGNPVTEQSPETLPR